MTQIKLGTSMAQCPEHWRNFIRHLQDKHHGNYAREVSTRILNRELKKYGARYCSFGIFPSNDHVEFDSPEQLTFFVLSWS